MATATQFSMVLASLEDGLFTASSASVNQTRQGGQVIARTPINTSSFPASTATKAISGMSGVTSLHDVLVILSAATTLASTTGQGIVYRMSAAPAIANQPIAMEKNDPVIANIPSAAIAAGLTAAASPSATNAILSQSGADLNPAHLGTGKDGVFAVGAITDPVTAPSGLSSTVLAGAIPAATYSYKVSLYNVSGDTLPTAASSTITIGSASSITMTIPTGGAGTMGRKLWRDNGGSSWKLVAVIGDNTTTSYTDSLPITSATTAPGSNTTGATWTNPTGEWHFTGDMSLAAITLGTTGTNAGNLIIRCRGNVTIAGAITADGKCTTPGLGSGQNGGSNVSTTTAAFSSGGLGQGANWQMVNMGGVGGSSFTGANAGGNAGGTIRIYAYSITINANVSANGSAAANITNSAAGGGAGGTIVFVARDYITCGAVTISANGGAGGNSASGQGGGGGGGGYCMFLAPIINRASATVTVTAGAIGTGTTGSTGNQAGSGGGNAGYGGTGTNGQTTGLAAGAGLIIDGGTAAVGYRFPTHAL